MYLGGLGWDRSGVAAVICEGCGQLRVTAAAPVDLA